MGFNSGFKGLKYVTTCSLHFLPSSLYCPSISHSTLFSQSLEQLSLNKMEMETVAFRIIVSNVQFS